MCLPASVKTSVYAADCEFCGMFLKPTALVPSTVQPERVPDVGVPRTGVTKVGEVAKTKEPEPVSSVTAAAKLDEEGVPRNVATFVPSPDTPVEIGSPVAFVKVPEEGVPKIGVTQRWPLANTKNQSQHQ
jgi:hypothetical protein